MKSDTIGRVRMPKDKRELILDRFEESGMTGLAFARHVGVKYPTFASWIQKRRRDRVERPASGPKRKRYRSAPKLVLTSSSSMVSEL